MSYYFIDPNEIHIWVINFEKIQIDKSIISIEEMRRKEKLHFQKDKDKYLTCRYCLRKVLEKYLSYNASEIRFEFNAYQKPYILSEQNESLISFNMSHTDHLLYIAIGKKQEIGIDIEEIKEKDGKKENLSEVFMSPKELQFFEQIESDKLLHFYQIWTQKEAYLKAIGTGFSTDPKKIDMVLTLDLNIRNHQINNKIINTYKFSDCFLSICTCKKVKVLFFNFE